MPVKKIGSDTPARAMPMADLSKKLPRRSADSTPVATPPTSHSTAAPMPSESVTRERSIRLGQTGCWLMKE